MFKKLVSTILIMALLLQCSALTVFADSEIAELLDVDAATVATGTDLPPVETKPEVLPENTTPGEPKQEETAEPDTEASEPETEVIPEEKQEDATTEQPAEKTEDVHTYEEQVTAPEEKTEQQVDAPVEKEEQPAETPSEKEENNPSASDVVIETPVIPEDNTQEKFEESLEAVENSENDNLTEARKGYFSLYEDEVPLLEEVVRSDYGNVGYLNYNYIFGQHPGTVSFEEVSTKTVKSIIRVVPTVIDLEKDEAVIALYLFGEENPVVKLEVVYESKSNSPIFFENAAGSLVELGTPKFNAYDGLLHSVVYLDKNAMDKLNFYANEGYLADILKIVATDVSIYAMSISAEKYCFANAIKMLSDSEGATPIFENTINFPEAKGYGYSVSYNNDTLSFNCLKGSWIEILFDNDDIKIVADDSFAFTLPEVPAGKVEATLPKDDEKKNGEKDKDEKDEENKLATDTDLAVKDNSSSESKPATNTDLSVNNIPNRATDTDLYVEADEVFAPVLEEVPVATVVEVEVAEDVIEPIVETVVEEVAEEIIESVEVAETDEIEVADEVVEDITAVESDVEDLDTAEIEEDQAEVDEASEEDDKEEDVASEEAEDDSSESGEQTNTEPDPVDEETAAESDNIEDYSPIEELIEEDTTPIEFDSSVVEFDSTEIDFGA